MVPIEDHGPSAGQGLGPDEAPELGPPPAPGTRWDIDPDRSTVATAPVVERRRGRRTGAVVGVVALVLLAAGGGFAGGLAASDRMAVPELLRDRALADAEREADMIGLLEDVIRTERVMLAFNDELARRLEGVQDEQTAWGLVAGAAAEGVGGLTALRPFILERAAGGRVEGVRTAYVPHLDAWIDYLAALAERPELLFTDEEQQPYLLLINATAEDFGDALEELLATGATAEVAALAEGILDDGFRSEGPDPSV